MTYLGAAIWRRQQSICNNHRRTLSKAHMRNTTRQPRASKYTCFITRLIRQV